MKLLTADLSHLLQEVSLLFLGVICLVTSFSSCNCLDLDTNEKFGTEITLSPSDPEPPKLLILLVDGFRWDYYSRLSQKQNLPGFHQLVSNGVQAKFVEPIFPSLSYPSWTTLCTGLYPAHHNILGNYMLYLGNGDSGFDEMTFQLKTNSTKNSFWWKYAEPLWITATKARQKVYMANFANCDVPFEGILPTECTGYKYNDMNFKLRDHLNKALSRFRDGYTLAMVYDDSIDHAGHVWGPDSNEIKLAIIALDSLLQELFMNLRYHGMQDKVNVVLTSDHGMTSIKVDSGVQYVLLESFIEDPEDTVYKVVDYGTIVSIAANPGRSEKLYQELADMPGVNVYRREEIPEEFHYKESLFVHDLLLVARPGYFIVGLKGDKQIPNEAKAASIQPYAASHGYYNMTDMRTVFYARGPAFKKGYAHGPIKLEDQYQIFARILQLQPLPNNGTWENVVDMFETQTFQAGSSNGENDLLD